MYRVLEAIVFSLCHVNLYVLLLLLRTLKQMATVGWLLLRCTAGVSLTDIMRIYGGISVKFATTICHVTVKGSKKVSSVGGQSSRSS